MVTIHLKGANPAQRVYKTPLTTKSHFLIWCAVEGFEPSGCRRIFIGTPKHTESNRASLLSQRMYFGPDGWI